MTRLALRAGALAALAALIAAVPAGAATKKPTKAKETYLSRVDYQGVQHIRYRMPLSVKGGADDIRIRPLPPELRPKVPGYITRFQPSLTLSDGTLPSVDVIHLHHAVWLVNGRPTFAA